MATTRRTPTPEQQALALLAEIGGGKLNDDNLVFEGTKLVIPAGMTVDRAIKFLRRWQEAQTEEHAFHRTFKYRPFDGAAATKRAMKKAFGNTGIGKTEWSFFGKIPPATVTIQTGLDETMQVPWGNLTVPMFENATMRIGATEDAEVGAVFHITIEAQKKYAPEIEGFFRLVERELQEFSIYKGQAINGAENPEFVDLSGVDPARVVYNQDVRAQLDANLWSSLRHTDVTQKFGLPLKRAVLLAGPYGSGKTLAATMTGQIATANGWTYVYCRPGKDDFETVMKTAQLYQPAVVFLEDVDTIGGSQSKDRVSRLLDVFDGVSSKSTRILAVLTTNHVEELHKGMVRPGRLDAIIEIDKLDAPAVRDLVVANLPPELLSVDDIDWDRVQTAMDEYLPAFVKEASDRAVRYAIARTSGHPDLLSTDDLVHAAEGLRPQFNIMLGATEESPQPTMDAALATLIDAELNGAQITYPNGEQLAKLALVDERGQKKVK